MGVRLWFASEKMEPPAPIMKTEYENDTEPDADRGGVARRDGHPYGDEGRRRKVAASTYSRLRYLINGRTVIHIPA